MSSVVSIGSGENVALDDTISSVVWSYKYPVFMHVHVPISCVWWQQAWTQLAGGNTFLSSVANLDWVSWADDLLYQVVLQWLIIKRIFRFNWEVYLRWKRFKLYLFIVRLYLYIDITKSWISWFLLRIVSPYIPSYTWSIACLLPCIYVVTCFWHKCHGKNHDGDHSKK
jgi:hypothetical protein